MGKIKFVFIAAMLPFLLGAQRIINGTSVMKTDSIYWSTVRLIGQGVSGYWVPACTGVILANNLVLTAAHCVENSPKEKILIAYELQPFTFEQQQYDETRIDPTVTHDTRAVLNWEIHPGYLKDKTNNDLAVIRIEGVHPEKFHQYPMISSEVAKKIVKGKYYSITIAGYGLFASNPTVESEELRQTKVSGKFTDHTLEVDQNQGSGGCYGDSGGPAIINIGSYSYLVGITHGSKTKNPYCDGIGVWANLADHLDFLYLASEILK